MNQLDQTIEDLKFCVETLGMNDEQVEEFMDITGQFGVRPVYDNDDYNIRYNDIQPVEIPESEVA